MLIVAEEKKFFERLVYPFGEGDMNVGWLWNGCEDRERAGRGRAELGSIISFARERWGNGRLSPGGGKEARSSVSGGKRNME